MRQSPPAPPLWPRSSATKDDMKPDEMHAATERCTRGAVRLWGGRNPAFCQASARWAKSLGQSLGQVAWMNSQRISFEIAALCFASTLVQVLNSGTWIFRTSDIFRYFMRAQWQIYLMGCAELASACACLRHQCVTDAMPASKPNPEQVAELEAGDTKL